MNKPTLELSLTVPEINRLHAEIRDAARTSIEKAIRIGELLTQQKSTLKHGEWLPWLECNLEFDRRTATNYMRLFERRDELKWETISHLTEAYALLEEPKKKLTDSEQVAANWKKITQEQWDDYVLWCCALDEIDERRLWSLECASFGEFCWRKGISKSLIDLAFEVLDIIGLRGVSGRFQTFESFSAEFKSRNGI